MSSIELVKGFIKTASKREVTAAAALGLSFLLAVGILSRYDNHNDPTKRFRGLPKDPNRSTIEQDLGQIKEYIELMWSSPDTLRRRYITIR